MLAGFALLLGASSSALAAGALCSDYTNVGTPANPSYVVDGFVPGVYAQVASNSTFGIDADCTIRNFPQSIGGFPINLTNFNFPKHQDFIIVFDNVYYTGGMSCQDPTFSDFWMWWVNGSYNTIDPKCQEFMLPVDAIQKENPVGQTTASVGVPFTYTLTMPVMMKLYENGYEYEIPVTDSEPLTDVHIYDDLTKTGADLSVVGEPELYWKGTNTQLVKGSDYTYSNVGGLLTFNLPVIPANQQVEIRLTVVLNDSAANAPATQFVNTATWTFDKTINGIFKNDLPGQNGITPPMTIVGPNLVVDKSSTVTNLNVNGTAPIKIDVHNTDVRDGVSYASDAWNATIKDVLPIGMCGTSPLPTLTAQIFAADGVTPVSGVLSGTDYTATYSGCTLELTLKDTVKIAPEQHLVIRYDARFDPNTTPTGAFTNIAGATDWYSDVTNSPRKHYGPYTLTDGTVGTADFQDAHTIYAAVVGYYLLKSVENLTTGTTPSDNTTLSAYPGDRLRYTLQIQNFTLPALNDISISDDLGKLAGALVVPGSLALVPGSTLPAGTGLVVDPNGGTNGAGLITISNLDLPSDTDKTGIVYQIQFDVTVATPTTTPATLSNQAQLLYALDDLGATWSGVSDDPFIGGPARLGDTAATFHPTNATIYAPPPAPPTKALVSPAPTAAEATIGQEVIYQIKVPGTPSVGALYDVQVVDTADSNLEFLSDPAVVVTGVTGATVQTTATGLTVDIPQIPAGEQAVITLHARVRNVTTAQQGVDINNTASFTYAYSQGGATQPALSSSEVVTVNIVEPHIATITKTPSKTAPTSGETIRYSVTLETSGGADSSDAFDVTLTDTLAAGLEYVGNPTVTVGTGVDANNTIGDPVISGAGTDADPYKLVWSLANGDDIDIPEGTTVTIAYDVRVQNSVLAGTALTNSVVAQWTGIDGAPPAYERDGSDGIGLLNDYITAPATATVTTPNINATIAKTRISDTYGAADANVRIGDIVEYELRVTMPEGALGNLQLADTLPQGLQFENIVSVNGDTAAPYAAVAPFTHADVAAPDVTGDASTGPTTVTWTLGSVTNQPVDGASNDFVIVYRARVLNNVFADSDLSVPLTNTVNMSYDTATGPVTQTDSEAITALQPMLTVTKSSNPVSGSSVAGGDTVTYTVDIKNDGSAPAYDVLLQDIIPVGMRSGVTQVSATLLSNAAVAAPTPTYDAATGIATWTLSSGSIPAGDTLRIVYQVTVDAGVSQGATLTNQAQVQTYYSFDDGTPPVAGVTTTREVYGPSNTDSTTLYTGAAPTKTLISPAAAEATIGQEVIYEIKVPGTATTNPLYGVQITDAADPNLEFVGAEVTGVTGATVQTTATGLTVGIAQIPAGQQAVITLRARVRNVSTAQQATDINNSVSYTYSNTSGGTSQPAQTSDVVTLNIVEPHINTITKVADKAAATTGDIVRYSVTLTAAGGTDSSDVFDATITDTLGAGLEYAGNPSVSAGNTISAPVITGAGTAADPYKLVWSLANGNDIDIPEGTAVIVSYDVRVLDSVVDAQPLTNSVVAQWTGIDGTPTAYERDGSGGVNDYITQPATATVTALGAILASQKTVQRWDAATGAWLSGATANPGDKLRYTITVVNSAAVPLNNFTLVDEIDRLNDPDMFTGTITNVSVPPGATPVVNAGTLTVNGLNIAANSTLTVAFEVDLVPVITSGTVVLNQGQIMNSAGVSLGYTDNDADAATGVNPTATTIASAPVMQVLKTAQDMTGDATLLMPGDTLRYTITVKNVGTENAANVALKDLLPANTTYVANSTTLNGTAVADVSGQSPLEAGFLIHAPEDSTPGAMRADASATTSNVATIVFDVVVDAATMESTVISNQGSVTGTGTSTAPFTEKLSDDPATTVLDDATDKKVVKPNGVIYNAITRQPVAGVKLTLVDSTGAVVPASCFSDPAQQGQVTSDSGYYKFDLLVGTSCPAGDYVIQVTSVPADLVATPSQIIPPSSSAATPYSVINCANDAVSGGSPTQCEAQASASAPSTAVLPADAPYYLHLSLGANVVDNSTTPPTTTDINNQIFHNHIALDPKLESALTITKKAHLVNVTRGQMVPYTITVENTMPGTLTGMAIVDTFPAGFKYVEGSARHTVEGAAAVPFEPVKNGRELRWGSIDLATGVKHTIQLLLVVSSGVSEGEYVNQAQALSTMLTGNTSEIATATVRVIPDPTFDCTDVIGKVFDDANRNGYQDAGEKGLPNVRVATARGLLVTSDDHGRFHITCAVVPDENRGSNFILKVDDRTLPTGYRITTENPRVQRVTRGKMAKFNFGAAIQKIVRIDISNGVFEPGTTEMRLQWQPRMDLLLGQLKKGPSTLRLAYMAEIEDEKLVEARLKALKEEVAALWAQQNNPYELVIETEVFWRTGAPPSRSALK